MGRKLSLIENRGQITCMMTVNQSPKTPPNSTPPLSPFQHILHLYICFELHESPTTQTQLQSSEHLYLETVAMSDWGPVFVSLVLFVLLTPGLLFQLPGRSRCVEFGNFQTSGAAILIHSLLYFAFICVFLLALKIHLYLG
ncbi:hypothetical protein VNO78_11227 [Psophocarpus tetragonolobus]|uniref:Transmembrane protein n=1 Tax=Psophocarpus tetragonolobus TaxID=3891 RepID=A0AAN9XNF1_PSOTE